MTIVDVPAGMKVVYVPDAEPGDPKLRARYYFALDAIERLAERATAIACAEAEQERTPADELRLAIDDVEVVTAALAHLQRYEDVIDVLIADAVLQVARPDPDPAVVPLSAGDAIRRAEQLSGVRLDRQRFEDAVEKARDESDESAFAAITAMLQATGRRQFGRDPAEALRQAYHRGWRRRHRDIANG